MKTHKESTERVFQIISHHSSTSTDIRTMQLFKQSAHSGCSIFFRPLSLPVSSFVRVVFSRFYSVLLISDFFIFIYLRANDHNQRLKPMSVCCWCVHLCLGAKCSRWLTLLAFMVPRNVSTNKQLK